MKLKSLNLNESNYVSLGISQTVDIKQQLINILRLLHSRIILHL